MARLACFDPPAFMPAPDLRYVAAHAARRASRSAIGPIARQRAAPA